MRAMMVYLLVMGRSCSHLLHRIHTVISSGTNMSDHCLICVKLDCTQNQPQQQYLLHDLQIRWHGVGLLLLKSTISVQIRSNSSGAGLAKLRWALKNLNCYHAKAHGCCQQLFTSVNYVWNGDEECPHLINY